MIFIHKGWILANGIRVKSQPRICRVWPPIMGYDKDVVFVWESDCDILHQLGIKVLDDKMTHLVCVNVLRVTRALYPKWAIFTYPRVSHYKWC